MGYGNVDNCCSTQFLLFLHLWQKYILFYWHFCNFNLRKKIYWYFSSIIFSLCELNVRWYAKEKCLKSPGVVIIRTLYLFCISLCKWCSTKSFCVILETWERCMHHCVWALTLSVFFRIHQNFTEKKYFYSLWEEAIQKQLQSYLLTLLLLFGREVFDCLGTRQPSIPSIVSYPQR